MRFMITAGPTREAIDPVRYLTNRSSGKMGYALASAAMKAGHEVVLISGPVNLASPRGCDVLLVESACEMYTAVKKCIRETDVAIFSAAVADYRIAHPADEKIKKNSDELSLKLTKNPDILGSARQEFGFTGFLVGFAAETNNLEENAVEKLTEKGCDLIVANDVSRADIGFDLDENEVTLFYKGGRSAAIPFGSKSDIAIKLISEIDWQIAR